MLQVKPSFDGYKRSARVHVKRTCGEIHTCTTCTCSHYLFQHLEPGGSKGSRDVRVFHYLSERGNVHRPHNGQPVDNKVECKFSK